MVAQLPMYCQNCNKKYLSSYHLNKHKLLCCSSSNTPLSLTNKLPDLTGKEAVEASLTPSLLLQTVQELILSNHKMKEEIAELKKIAYKQDYKQSQKLQVLDILTKMPKPSKDYQTYLNIKISRKDLEIVFTDGLVVGIQEIIQNKINADEEDCPVKAFDQKSNKIYGYTKNKTWELIPMEEFDKIFLNISKYILDEFKVWQDEHEAKIYTDIFSAIYLENVKKVMGGKSSRESQHKKIHKGLYMFLKKSVQDIEE